MVADLLANLGSVRQDEGRYPEARELYGRALALLERRFGTAHYAVAAVIQNLGDLDRQTGQYQQAFERFRQAGALVEETLGRENRLFAATLLKRAQALEGMESYAEAIPPLREALAIRRALYDPGAPVVVDCVIGIIDVLMAQGEFEAARAEAVRDAGRARRTGDVPPRSLERLRLRVSNIDDILGYNPGGR